jgi:hypothetical protein
MGAPATVNGKQQRKKRAMKSAKIRRMCLIDFGVDPRVRSSCQAIIASFTRGEKEKARVI